MREMDTATWRDKRNEIVSRCGIHRDTFRNWCNIGINEYRDIPAQALDIIAAVLGKTSNELKNYKIGSQITNHESP